MKPKKELQSNWMEEVFKKLEKRRGEYIRSRFYVVEQTPSKRLYQNDGHGRLEPYWTKPKNTRVSDYFDTREEADEVFNNNAPDDGNALVVREDKLYRRVVEEWH